MTQRTCFAGVSERLHFNAENPTCRQCHLRDECGRITRERVAKAEAARSSSRYGSTSSPSTTSTQSSTSYSRTLLEFDPMPEAEETMLERLMFNMLSAGAAAVTQESSNMFRRWKFGARSQEHNANARITRDKLRLTIEENKRLHEEAKQQQKELERYKRMCGVDSSEESEGARKPNGKRP